jgi:hypothetical protein
MIYQYQLGRTRLQEEHCHKNLLKTLYKNKWIEKLENDTLIVTDKGIDAAKEIAPLYEKDFKVIGQTF